MKSRPTVHWTVGTVDVQDDTPVDCISHGTSYPFDIQPLNALKFIILSKQLRLETAHLAGAGGISLRSFPATTTLMGGS